MLIAAQYLTCRLAMVSRFASYALVFLLLASAAAVGNEPQPELVRMSIVYKDTMLVVVSRDGAGGIRFFDAFERANDTGNGIVGCSYEWRYLPRQPGAAEATGKGSLFAKLVNGAVRNGELAVTCGPLELEWIPAGKLRGSVQFAPAKIAVHPVAAGYFSAVKNAPNAPIDPVDLGRFLSADEVAAAAHRAEDYTDPDTETKNYPGQVAGSVLYKKCLLVARDPQGIATFQFGRPFEKHLPEKETRYVVPYDFTFTSHDGTVQQSGHDEVYEREVDGKYKKGRLYLEAGPIHFYWSRGGDESGWAYYDPAWIRIWNVELESGKTLVDALTTAKFPPESDKSEE